MGYIRELDRSPSNCSEQSDDNKAIKTTGDTHEDCNWMHSLKKNRSPQKKQAKPLDKKYFVRMKNTATDILIRKIANEKSLDNLNKSDFNRNSNFYLDFFGEMKNKLNFAEVEGKVQKDDKITFDNEKAPGFQKKLFQRFNKIRNLNKLKIDQNNRKLKSNPNIQFQSKKPNLGDLPVLKAFDKNKFKQILQEQEMANEKENNNLESERNNTKKFRIVTKKAGNSKTKIKLIVE